jgi:hypothetical protein
MTDDVDPRAVCPGLPDDPYPCGRALLTADRAGLCLPCELRGEATHGITLTTGDPRGRA